MRLLLSCTAFCQDKLNLEKRLKSSNEAAGCSDHVLAQIIFLETVRRIVVITA